MRDSRLAFQFLAVLMLVLGLVVPAAAQLPPPQPAAGGPPNIFYGLVPPAPPAEPQGAVLVFVHGLHGTAADWWVNNDMYQKAFQNGYRTAFVGLNADNTPNDAGIADNAAMLQSLLPQIAAHYHVPQMYLVGHSKGGVDIEAALLNPVIAHMTRGVFTISTPNSGSELADWAFGPGAGIAAGLNLLTPGVFALRTQNMTIFRSIADPILKARGIPFHTIEGSTFTGNPLTEITGLILLKQAPGQKNDGFVTVQRAKLPDDYAADLGQVAANHFLTDSGDESFAKINARLQALEFNYSQFQKISAGGFGDDHNNWSWSMGWFKGKLYVGTGREVQCVSLLTSDVQAGTQVYNLSAYNGDCPTQDALKTSLAAEIWTFDPATNHWSRVYQSPQDIFLGNDSNGNPIFTARDVGYRGMTTFTEPDGTEAFYIGGVTSGSIYEQLPQFAAGGFPPPRLLRTTDGVNFQAVPETPGTFLGEIGNPLPGSTRPLRSFRGLTPYHGKLFATVGDYRGVGVVVASANPKAGDNAWYLASPVTEQFPVWNVVVFNDYLYATIGDKDYSQAGYGLYKTSASGPAPYNWIPIVTGGGYQADPRVRAPNGLSFAIFKGQLYMGTNRPTELIRVNPDDTWDLITGESRMTPAGMKTPLSGLGVGFGSWLNGHFWRMAAHGDYLYLETWDWSIGVRNLQVFDKIFAYQYGTDVYRTSDGVHWTAMTRNGFQDGLNSGGRSILSTPAGLFIGTARPIGGTQVYRCSQPSCSDASAPPAGLPAPQLVEAVPESVAGRTAILSWDAVPGAVKYRVYRSMVVGLNTFLPNVLQQFQVPGLPNPITIEDIKNGVLDLFCMPMTPEICTILNAIKTSTLPDVWISLPTQVAQIGITGNVQFSEPAPTAYQSLYFVRAEDANGNLSSQSNFVGAPAKNDPLPADSTPPVITPVLTPPPNAAGWNNTPVTVSWQVTDPDSGIQHTSNCGPVTLSTNTAGTVLTCDAVNGRGMAAEASVTVKLDQTPPVVTAAPSALPNGNGWYSTAVTVSFSAVDALSGVASVAPPVTVATEGAGQAIVGTATDVAGNVGTATLSVSLDMTPPEAILRFGTDSHDVQVLGSDALSGPVAGAIAPFEMNPIRWGDDDDHGDEQASGRRDDGGRFAAARGWSFTRLASFLVRPTAWRGDRSGGAPAWASYDDRPDRDQHRGQRGNRTPQPNAQQRSYRVTDLAGNSTVLVVDVKQEGTQLRYRVDSVRYGDQAALNTPNNDGHFEWSLVKGGTDLRNLEQGIGLSVVQTVQSWHGHDSDHDGRLEIEADFTSKKNQTSLKVEGYGEGAMQVYQGLFLLPMATSQGSLVADVTLPTPTQMSHEDHDQDHHHDNG